MYDKFIVTALAAAAAFGASADDGKPAAPPSSATAAPIAPAEAAPPPALLGALDGVKPLANDALDDQRARAKLEIDKVVINAPEQNGVVAGNTAIGNANGPNTIGGDAFSTAAGFINAVQNTGNNVLIQTSTIINVSVEP